jgi:hypothetical protein
MVSKYYDSLISSEDQYHKDLSFFQGFIIPGNAIWILFNFIKVPK